MRKWMSLWMVVGMLVAVGAGLHASTAPAKSARPMVWMMPPPWERNGGCLRELLQHDDQWSRTRSQIDGLGYWPSLLNVHFSDAEIHTLFTKLKKWNLRFTFEVQVLKKDLPTARQSFDQLQGFTTRFKPLGMFVDSFSFDEPYYAAKYFLGKPDEFAIEEVASYIAMLRAKYPNAEVGDIEPYPALTFAEITSFMDRLQAKCAEKGVKGPDFLRLDVDWAGMNNWLGGSWPEAKKIEDHCHSKGLRFVMTYCAVDYDVLKPKGLDYDMMWYVGIMHQGNAYAMVGGKPDAYVIESWLHTPPHAIPESDMTTFSRSVLDFCKYFVPGRK